jgi:hypothetical protein
MNTRIVTGALIIFFCLPVLAHAKSKEQPPPKPLTADDIVAKMKVQLELTDQQVEEVKPIITDYLAQEKQIKLEEKKQLSRVLTGDQMYAWNFLQNEPPPEKKKRSGL